jgi:hypothetical protein
LSAGLGGATTSEVHQKLFFDLRARYLDVIGLAVSPEWNFGGQKGAIAIVLDLRPLFIARFLSNAYFGRAWIDLLLDSIGAELGSWLGPSDHRFGAGLLLGIGVEAPLYPGESTGLWLRLAGRYVVASSNDKTSPQGGKSEFSVMMALLIRTAADLGLASWEP